MTHPRGQSEFKWMRLDKRPRRSNLSLSWLPARIRCQGASKQSSDSLQLQFGMPAKKTLLNQEAWRIQFETTQACVLDVHLSLMADPGAHLYRQAWLQTPHQGHAHQYPAYTVSGLVPWVPNAWAAQCLRPGLGHEAELDAKKEHLSHFSGRWPQSLGHQGLQSLAIRVDESALRRGALTLSANGHRWVRATGTSMAVPLAAHWLSEQTNH